MQAKRKLKKRAGFSLAETMLAVLILLLVSGIVAAGIPAAKNAYLNVVVGANAQVLASTAINALRDELGMAWDVEPDADGKGITYFSANTGARSHIYTDGSGGDGGSGDASATTIMIQEYMDAGNYFIVSGTPSEGSNLPSRMNARPLITEKARTSDLYVVISDISVNATAKHNSDYVSFSLEAGRVKDGDPTALVELSDVTIPVFSAVVVDDSGDGGDDDD